MMNSQIIEQTSYFEIAGFKLAKENFGKPNSTELEINPEVASHSKPQAWSKDIDGIEYWFYNFKASQKEAEYLGVTIPTLEEFIKIFATISGDAVQKAQVLNFPLIGYRNMNNGEFVSIGKRAAFWTSSCDGEIMADSICLQVSCQNAHGNLYGHALGLSTRAFIR
ncbi:MAG: hypothetical protein PHH70_03390 [Candidatus Gracilibacteria bacterium]|nr:hypothetical protein [Candidatus Gracilibacteria bacterium]